MPREYRSALFEFLPAEGWRVVAAFDCGAITSDAGALPPGAANRVVHPTERFAACFKGQGKAELVEHQIGTLVTERVVGIAVSCGV